jgi:hypothetical protein
MELTFSSAGLEAKGRGVGLDVGAEAAKSGGDGGRRSIDAERPRGIGFETDRFSGDAEGEARTENDAEDEARAEGDVEDRSGSSSDVGGEDRAADDRARSSSDVDAKNDASDVQMKIQISTWISDVDFIKKKVNCKH